MVKAISTASRHEFRFHYFSSYFPRPRVVVVSFDGSSHLKNKITGIIFESMTDDIIFECEILLNEEPLLFYM
jgi:hypothetical protein